MSFTGYSLSAFFSTSNGKRVDFPSQVEEVPHTIDEWINEQKLVKVWLLRPLTLIRQRLLQTKKRRKT
jgi:hypothetical protein